MGDDLNKERETLPGGNHTSLELLTDEKPEKPTLLPPKPNVLTKFLQSNHDAVGGFFDKHSKLVAGAWNIFLYVILAAYFAWATQYFIANSTISLYDTTCDGYGFLMILFIFVNFGVCHYWVLKPFVYPALKRSLWTPLKGGLGPILTIWYVQTGLYVALLVAFLIYLIIDTANNRYRLIPLIGLSAFLLFGFVFCKHPQHIQWRPVIWGLILQISFGLLTIRWDVGRNVFGCLGDKVTIFLNYANNGSSFVYGDFIVNELHVFVFQAIATIFFLGFMINILYHYGIMQKIIVTMGVWLQRIMGTTICESVNGAANIFLGPSEVPLLLKPYLENLTASELHTIMCSGFATVAGTTLAAYISFGVNAAHLIIASVMSAPAALAYSKLVFPETEQIMATKESIKVSQSEYTSVLDAACKGAMQAMEIVLGITSNLIAFIACIYFINGVLAWFGVLVGYTDPDNLWSVTKVVEYVFTPISYVMGVPWEDCGKVGKLIGIKIIVNEFAAYKEMGQTELLPRSKIIATYALCGFGNPGAIGITISSFATLMPNKQQLVTDLVFRAFIAGTIVCFLTASTAGLLVPDEFM